MPRPSPTTVHRWTRGRGPRLVLAHGFTQTGRLWGGLDDDLAADHQLVQVDMPGHGQSGGVRTGLVDGALQLVEVGGRATYVGYSMGARFCLHAALARPDAVGALVLVSGTAGIEDDAERRQRRRADLDLADRLDPPDGWPGPPAPLREFLTEWTAQAMFANLGPGTDGMDERLSNTGTGLASSLRLAGTGSQLPLWAHLDRLAMPVLVITGGDDTTFTALGARMAAVIGDNADHVVLPGAGHAPHLEQPGAAAERIRGLLAALHA